MVAAVSSVVGRVEFRPATRKDEAMGSVRAIVFAGAVTLLSLPAAQAADLPAMPPPPVIHDFSGWYLRGDIGMTNQQVKSLYNSLYSTFDSVLTVQKDVDFHRIDASRLATSSTAGCAPT